MTGSTTRLVFAASAGCCARPRPELRLRAPPARCGSAQAYVIRILVPNAPVGGTEQVVAVRRRLRRRRLRLPGRRLGRDHGVRDRQSLDLGDVRRQGDGIGGGRRPLALRRRGNGGAGSRRAPARARARAGHAAIRAAQASPDSPCWASLRSRAGSRSETGGTRTPRAARVRRRPSAVATRSGRRRRAVDPADSAAQYAGLLVGT